MKVIYRGFLIALVVLSATGCATRTQPSAIMKSPIADAGEGFSTNWAKAQEKTLELVHYAKRSEVWRRRARAAFHNYDRYQKSHKGKIAASDLVEIKRLANQYANELWHPLWDLMLSPYFYMDLTRDVQIQTHRESYIETDVIRYMDSMGDVVDFPEDPVEGTPFEPVSVDVYHINPHDQRGRVFIREFEISFAAALVLTDNYLWGWEPYLNNKIIRRSLLYDLQGSGDDTRRMVKAIWNNYRSFKNSGQWTAAFEVYEKARRITKNAGDPLPFSVEDSLAPLIEGTATFKLLSDESKRKSLFRQLAGELKFVFRKQGDRLEQIGNRTTHVVSKTFGNSAGLFQSRRGKLKHLPEPEVQKIVSNLKPLDILFEKTPFRLTDKFIPGHYGHVAVWVGTESELRELGVWDQLPGLYRLAVEHYSYKGPSFQQSIREGKHIIEALRPGVQINSMRHFLDIDDLAVIRPKNCPAETGNSECLTPERKRQYLLEAFKQVGKEYDFNFDVNTESEIVCSELAYRTFVDLDFSTTRTFGKHSMSPDQVALLADDETDPFYPVLLYFDGKRIPAKGESLRKVFSLLLKKEYSSMEEAFTSKAESH